MSKHFKSRFFTGEASESSSKPKCNIEFFQLLKSYMRRPGTNLRLNMPETIILNSPNCESVLFFSDSDHSLTCKESITNEYVKRFLKRCYYYFKPPYPIVILKANKSNFSDSCRSMANLKDCYTIWKNREQNPSYFALQRFITPPEGELFKIRVFFSIPKNQMLFRVIKKKEASPCSTPGKSKGWTRLKHSNSLEPQKSLDSYFVRNGDEFASYESEMRNLAVIEQVKSLKKVIESVGSSDGSFNLLELYADFLQSAQGDWYFLNVVNYKLEFVVNKKPSTGLPNMKRRTISSQGVKSHKNMNLVHNEELTRFLSFEDTLINDVIKDLKPRKLRNFPSGLLYCKAYHLKLINS